MKPQKITGNQLIRISVVVILLVVVASIPREIVFDETKVVCIHYYLFGFQCPLCGMTRAVYEFTHLHFLTAIHYNAIVTLLPLYFIVDLATIFFNQSWLKTARKWIVISIFAGLLLLYVFRIVLHFNWV